MSEIDFTISYEDMDVDSSFNQNGSHIHKECEIYINLSGDVSFEVEKRIYPVSRGSVIITRPYEYHHCIYHSNACHKHFWITFSAEGNEDFLQMFFDREKGTNNWIILNEEQLNECCMVIDNLLNNHNNSLMRRINFLQIFRILSGVGSRQNENDIEHLPKDVATAIIYMDNHLTEDMSVDELSGACNVSINTLERHFKETLGVSPIALLRKKRLIASMEHLRNGSSVTEAAFKSGFSDYSNYIQLFRKQFKITPLQYKKNFELK